MTARTFQEANGTIWQVFEVRRASEAPRGVSEGLEGGWLTFSSDAGKRRLAPVPAGWENAPPTELERLCGMARQANAAHFRREPRALGRSMVTEALLAARQETPAGLSDWRAADDAVDEHAAEVREIVRRFAREARASQFSAVEAMLRLKALLSERYDVSTSPALLAVVRDVRRVRRWFVDAFYFGGNS